MSPGNTFAFRIGYFSSGFQGYARQPRRETVEGVLRAGLLRRGVLRPEEEATYRTASRTDLGVHALGNVVSFSTHLSGAAAARAIDALDPRIFCFGFAEVGPSFNPRHARERWYRYLTPSEGRTLKVWKEGASLFQGEHDFSSFSRKDDPPRSPRSVVSKFVVNEENGLLVLDVRAPRFLWNQVRKMVGALELFDKGRLTATDLRAALAGTRVLHVPLAPADGLVLMEVVYDLEFTPVPSRGGAQRRRWLAEARREARTRETLLGWFQLRAPPPPRATSDP